MEVRYDEGLAIRIGPEPCASVREDGGEASAGVRIGQPSSRESVVFPEADVFGNTEGNMGSAISRALFPLRRGQRPWHVWKLFAREPGGLGFDRRLDAVGPHREGEEP